MTIFSIYLPKNNDLKKAKAIRCAFCWESFAFTPFWLFYRGIYSHTAIYLLIFTMLKIGSTHEIISSIYCFTLILSMHLYYGINARELSEIRLIDKKYRMVDEIIADSAKEALLIYTKQHKDLAIVINKNVVPLKMSRDKKSFIHQY